MSKSGGSIVCSMLYVNIFVGLLSILLMQLAGIFQTVMVAQKKELTDMYRLQLLIYIGKQYIKKNREIGLNSEGMGIIFDGMVLVGVRDSFNGKVAVYELNDSYVVEGTLSIANNTQKIVKKVVKKV